MPKELTAEHKRKRVEICQRLLDSYNNEGEEFLSRIVRRDETWVHHYEPESERQTLEWKHPGSPAKKKFKTQPSAGKVMLMQDNSGLNKEHQKPQPSCGRNQKESSNPYQKTGK